MCHHIHVGSLRYFQFESGAVLKVSLQLHSTIVTLVRVEIRFLCLGSSETWKLFLLRRIQRDVMVDKPNGGPRETRFYEEHHGPIPEFERLSPHEFILTFVLSSSKVRASAD